MASNKGSRTFELIKSTLQIVNLQCKKKKRTVEYFNAQNFQTQLASQTSTSGSKTTRHSQLDVCVNTSTQLDIYTLTCPT